MLRVGLDYSEEVHRSVKIDNEDGARQRFVLCGVRHCNHEIKYMRN